MHAIHTATYSQQTNNSNNVTNIYNNDDYDIIMQINSTEENNKCKKDQDKLPRVTRRVNRPHSPPQVTHITADTFCKVTTVCNKKIADIEKNPGGPYIWTKQRPTFPHELRCIWLFLETLLVARIKTSPDGLLLLFDFGRVTLFPSSKPCCPAELTVCFLLELSKGGNLRSVYSWPQSWFGFPGYDANGRVIDAGFSFLLAGGCPRRFSADELSEGITSFLTGSAWCTCLLTGNSTSSLRLVTPGPVSPVTSPSVSSTSSSSGCLGGGGTRRPESPWWWLDALLALAFAGASSFGGLNPDFCKGCGNWKSGWLMSKSSVTSPLWWLKVCPGKWLKSRVGSNPSSSAGWADGLSQIIWN